MKITKVKWLNDKIAIEYEKEDEAGISGNFAFTVAARPAPSFFKAMNGLTTFWEESLELPKKKDDLVYGLTCSYHAKSGNISATIQGMRYLEKSKKAEKKAEGCVNNDGYRRSHTLGACRPRR